jgi:hypothetical protein
MPTTPNWEAARGGKPGDLDATNHAAQVGQFLGTHNITPAYETGRFINSFGTADFTWVNYGNTTDLSQPFTVPNGVGTGVVRVAVPLMPVGNGADVLVSLCPDNGSGAPDTTKPLASTMLPASWIESLAAPNGLASGSPLASPTYNTFKATGGYQSTPWAGPTGDASGVAQNSSVTTSGNYLIVAGGSTSSSIIPVVNTIPYLGGTSVGLGVPQTPLPQGTSYGMLAATTSSLVYAGGLTGSVASPAPTASVWVASWDLNTGVVGSWSGQTALPAANFTAGVASNGNTVYIVGGGNLSTPFSSVYYATVTNGQIGAWIAGPSLPVALSATMCAVVNGWLIVAGGNTVGGASPGGSPVGTSYYAKINPDGSLSEWSNGPGIFGAYAYAPGWDIAVTDSAVVVVGGFAGAGGGGSSPYVQTLHVGPNGPSARWRFFAWRESGVELVGAFPTGTAGEWLLVNPNIPTSQVNYTTLIPVPWMILPLAATVTIGSTYHIVLQQKQTISTSDYVMFGLLDGSPTVGDALKSSRHSGTWTSALGSGWGMPIEVYNNQPVNGPVINTWTDPSSTGSTYTSNLAARVSCTLYNSSQLPIGLLESTNLPNDPMDQNPTFTSGTSPWVAHHCTLTQSSAQVHGGFSFSGLLTPAGGSSTANVTSELIPITAVFPLWSNAQWYQVNSWVYSPTGWSNVSLSVDWYDATSTFISTSSNTVSVSAATWTNLVNTYQSPSNASYASINVTESGTPGATNTLYLSNVTLALSPELTSVVAPVTEITYSGVLPTSITQLA